MFTLIILKIQRNNIVILELNFLTSRHSRKLKSLTPNFIFLSAKLTRYYYLFQFVSMHMSIYVPLLFEILLEKKVISKFL